MPIFYNSSLTEAAYVQDQIHITNKMRNKLLQPSMLMPMGNRQVSLTHLKLLIANFPKSHHGLVRNDICPDDRQNFSSISKVMKPEVLQYLQDNVPEIEATVLYLKLCSYSLHRSKVNTSRESISHVVFNLLLENLAPLDFKNRE